MTTMTEVTIRPFQFHASDEALADVRLLALGGSTPA